MDTVPPLPAQVLSGGGRPAGFSVRGNPALPRSNPTGARARGALARPPLPHAPLPHAAVRPPGSPRSLARPGRGPWLRLGRFLPTPSPPRVKKKTLLLLLPRKPRPSGPVRARSSRPALSSRGGGGVGGGGGGGVGGGGGGVQRGRGGGLAPRSRPPATARTAAGPRARAPDSRPGFASARPRVYLPSSMISNTIR
ncbi:uncharacterized protein LOC144582572 [Callithrix jacchus]